MSTTTAGDLPRVSLAPHEGGGRRTARVWARRLILYPAFFLLCFVVSAYWTFPYDRVRDILVAKASDGTSRLDIAELSPSWLTGIEASGITYTTYPTRPDERVSAIEIPEATARISLLTLLTGSLGGSFSVTLPDGEISGDVTRQGETGFDLEAELEGVDLRSIAPLRRAVGVPITGQVNGTVTLNAPEEGGLAQSTGNITLQVTGASIGDGRAKLRMPSRAGAAAEGDDAGITINRVSLGDFPIRLAIERGTATLERIQVRTPDIELELSGTVSLRQPMRQSRLSLNVRVKLQQAYLDRSPNIAGLLALGELDPRIASARTPDGFLSWTLSNATGSISFRPAGRARSRTRATRPAAGAEP